MPGVPAEMSCQDLVELLSDYLEDAVDAPTRARLEAHLERCLGCAAYFGQLRLTLRLLRAVRRESFSLDSLERVLQTVLAQSRHRAGVTNESSRRTSPTSRTT